mmetsp:Transcript_65130/g.174894  ORF Transcript_65130/g.174894 Transcript_65130/m.174894 type:complete len:94 (+) Transcript_65130:182-463(+)
MEILRTLQMLCRFQKRDTPFQADAFFYIWWTHNILVNAVCRLRTPCRCTVALFYRWKQMLDQEQPEEHLRDQSLWLDLNVETDSVASSAVVTP